DSRLRRSPPDRASVVPYGQPGKNAMRFPHLAHRSAAAHKLHSTPQQDRMNSISGKNETSSRLPGPYSLFLPGSCPNNRNRRRGHDGRQRRGFEAPIVEDEELDAGETAQDAGIAAVTTGEREFGEQLGNALIENRAVVAASLVSEGTSKPRFAHAGRPAQNQIVVRVDPFAIGELVEERAIEAAWGSVIDVLDTGRLAQSGISQSGGKPLIAAMGELAIEQEAEPVGMSERGGFVGSFELGKRLGHAGAAKLAQLV